MSSDRGTLDTTPRSPKVPSHRTFYGIASKIYTTETTSTQKTETLSGTSETKDTSTVKDDTDTYSVFSFTLLRVCPEV